MKVLVNLFITTCISFVGYTQTLKDLSSELIIKTYIDINVKEGTYDLFEGIWIGTEESQIFIDKKVLPSTTTAKRFGILKIDNDYKIIEIDKGGSGLTITKTQKYGEFIAKLNVEGFYSPAFEGAAKFTDVNNLRIVMEGSDEAKRQLLGKQYRDLIEGVELFVDIKLRKTYPTAYDIANLKAEALNEVPKSGTGFALSSNGFIATNHHVIENATTLKVRGVNGDFSTGLSAKVIESDQVADIAIIQIDDPKFTDLGKIPYPVASTSSEVGEEVFALGYPLTNTMGEEVKLTTGIISASSGYQGNAKQYQISVPVQPGNSGGPLFDKNGKVVGIINAKHSDTDNVSYAIKSSYLIGLFYMIPNTPVLDASLKMGKTLPEKVRQARNFVYIIEVNK